MVRQLLGAWYDIEAIHGSKNWREKVGGTTPKFVNKGSRTMVGSVIVTRNFSRSPVTDLNSTADRLPPVMERHIEEEEF